MIAPSTPPPPPPPDRRIILLLAGIADCRPITAAKALAKGVDTVRGANLRERLVFGMRELGLMPEEAASAIPVARATAGRAR